MDDRGVKKEGIEVERLIACSNCGTVFTGTVPVGQESLCSSCDANAFAKARSGVEDLDPSIHLILSVMRHMKTEDRGILLTMIESEYSPIRIMVRDVFENARAHGFWYEDTDKEKERLVRIGMIPQALALIHSEISEALEESRENGFDPQSVRYDYTRGEKPVGFSIELADAMIRIMDLAGALDIDLNKAIRLKHEYNLTRPKMHGKRF